MGVEKNPLIEVFLIVNLETDLFLISVLEKTMVEPSLQNIQIK
jgi:hypothetical protein